MRYIRVVTPQRDSLSIVLPEAKTGSCQKDRISARPVALGPRNRSTTDVPVDEVDETFEVRGC